MRVLWKTILAGLACPVAFVAAGAQQGPTITGHVTEKATDRPIGDANVVIVGTTRGARTDAQGEYRITNVTPGTYTIRVTRLGYTAAARSVTVAAPGATVDFQLGQTAATIDAVTVTATGETERKRETGATVATLDTSALNPTVNMNLSEALTARASGVTVTAASGQVGASSRIRIRGSNSISLSNDPLLIIDGVRVNDASASSSIGIGGQTTSRFDDLVPEEIEDVEVIKGPAAAALYGTAAANGVIQVTTKRGAAGRTRWKSFVEDGNLKDMNHYPANFLEFGTRTNGSLTTNCNIDFQARRLCTPDSLVTNNPLAEASPFQTGFTRTAGVSASGGSQTTTYFMSGELRRDDGVYAINHDRKLSLRTNVRSQLTKSFDATVSVGYIGSDLRLPQNDNDILGTISAGLLGLAWDCGPANHYPALCQGDTTSRGYISGQIPTDIMNGINTRQQVQRVTGSLNTNWQALPWLSFNGVYGGDIASRNDNEITYPNRVFFADLPDGNRTVNKATIATYTANQSGTATYDILPTLRSTSTAGVQYTDELFQRSDAFGAVLLAGTTSLAGTNARFAVNEQNTENRTIGALASEQLAWRDRLFVTGAARTDRNSAFGQNFGWIVYPALNASWVVSEEPFFPHLPSVSSLRLRTGWGSSGQRPNVTDAIQFFNPVAVNVGGADVPAFTVGGLGNPNLKPEKSTETEGGFDMGLFGDHTNVEYTHYSKLTKDALVAVTLAPSLGQTASRFQNLGRVRNWGDEMSLKTDIFSLYGVSADLDANVSFNHNKLLDLGVDAQGNPLPPIFLGFSSTQRIQNGFPLGGYFQRTYTFQDKNGDHVISRVNCPNQPQVAGGPDCEIVAGDTSSKAEFLGSPFPRTSINVTPALRFGRWLQLSALFDHEGGQKLYNNTRDFRCTSAFQNCRDVSDPQHTPLADQARAIAAFAFQTRAGYIEDATFTKLREVSATITMPREWAERVHSSNLELTLSGRNLHTWTNYSGFDPEVNALPTGNFSTADFLTQPQIRTFVARLSASF